MKKKIALAWDHRGFEIKDRVIEVLKQEGCDYLECGTFSSKSTDYVDYMIQAGEKIRSGECDAAIGACYTGIGSTIAANKVKGVRAALVHTVEEAELCRAHNDSNMLILGAGFMDLKKLEPIIQKWLSTSFEGGRHERRVDKIKRYEEKKC